MLKNYFLTTIRNLWKRKSFSLINIFGLAAGMAVSFLILLYVFHETSFDRFHEHSSEIYRIATDIEAQVYWNLGAMDWDRFTTKPSKKKLLYLGLDDIAEYLCP